MMLGVADDFVIGFVLARGIAERQALARAGWTRSSTRTPCAHVEGLLREHGEYPALAQFVDAEWDQDEDERFERAALADCPEWQWNCRPAPDRRSRRGHTILAGRSQKALVNRRKSTGHAADLHCHSTASQSRSWGSSARSGCPSARRRREEVHELAKRRGMDFVTITDHDTIDGVLAIADRPDVFLSEELTACFSGEPRLCTCCAWA